MVDGANSRCEAIDILCYFPQEDIVEKSMQAEMVKICKRKIMIETKLAKVKDSIKEKLLSQEIDL